ncbi:MAG TPA: protein translocase subunit SecDF, partial [Cytophagales bacterium]
MRNKNFLLFLTGLFVLICLYYLSFTFVARNIENKATDHARSANGQVDRAKRQAYLDSVWTEPVFLGFTYKDIKNQEVKLGLDLQGGMNVMMEVSAPDVLRVLSGNNPDPNFQKALADAQLASNTQQGKFTDFFYEAFKKRSPNASLASIFANKSNQDRINFQSTDQQVLSYVNEQLESTIDRSFEVLRNRIDRFGTTQPNIQQLQGTNRIQIELAGIEDPKRVRKLLQGAAKLEFYEVYQPNEYFPYYLQLNEYLLKQEQADKPATAPAAGDSLKAPAADPLAADNQTAAAPADTTDNLSAGGAANDTASRTANAQAKKDTAANAGQSTLLSKLFVPTGNGLGANVRDTAKVNALLSRPDVRNIFPPDMAIVWDAKPATLTDGTQLANLYFIKKNRNQGAPLQGDVIVNARPDFDQFGKPEVSMQMNARGAKAWKRLTAQNVGRQVAIVLDNVVYSAPVVQGEIAGGNSSISGSFTVEESKDLANILQAGKMPVPTRIVEETVVGPTLGQESINKGLLSIFIGFLIIVGFMVAYYSSSGWVANIAVLLNILLILGFLVPAEAVLTLPGIAGIVLTIGMAVDANVLINERVKDELRAGQTLINATSNGYRAASASIWDANITTFLAGLVLFFFGSGPIKGFATTLMIGIATSLFTSVYVTRLIAELRLRRGKAFTFSTSFSRNLFKDFNFDFVAKRKAAYIFSSVFILAGIVSMLTRGFDYGVDFKGGWTYIVEFKGNASADDIRQALTSSLGGAPQVKTYGASNKVQITTPYLIEDPSADAADRVEQAVRKGLDTYKANGYEIQGSGKVGPTVAKDIRNSAIIAVVLAMAFIFAYIWFRFQKWQYAMGATIAVIHDVLVILTVYTLGKDFLPFSLEIDQNFIAAILTIVGFSVNDTVVIFDRVRETFNDSALNADPAKVVNKALNDTFSRTIITSTTVFLVVLTLLLFGGETIQGLAFALLIGVITGVYSTIYIAVPFVVDAYQRRRAGQLAAATAK